MSGYHVMAVIMWPHVQMSYSVIVRAIHKVTGLSFWLRIFANECANSSFSRHKFLSFFEKLIFHARFREMPQSKGHAHALAHFRSPKAKVTDNEAPVADIGLDRPQWRSNDPS